MAAKQQKRPYTMVFCGVNGVGKSTNLAKITYAATERAAGPLGRAAHLVFVAGMSQVLAAAEQAARPDCSLRHLPLWRRRAAARARAQPAWYVAL